MDLQAFVAANRADWERLETLLTWLRGPGLSSFSPAEVRELGLLYKKVTADLSRARAEHPGSRVVEWLNDIALRAHNAVYRAPRRSAKAILAGLLAAIPLAVRRHAGAVGAAATLFFTGALLGGFGTAVDESVAEGIMGDQFVHSVRDGKYWIESVFDVVPHSVASTGILANNLSVAITAFALGITGVLTPLLLFYNGAMLGAVLVLCWRYHLSARFLPFLMPHGIIEISAILLAGAGGLIVADGWLHPGDASRGQGLRDGAREGLLVAGAAVPALLVAGPVEGLISPMEEIPALLRVAFGVALGLALWGWLTLYSRPARLIER